MSAHPRSPPRIQPPDPITVAIEDDRGTVIAYGVMADISRRGGCIQTDVLIVSDATFGLRLSFAYPPEMHRVVGRVAWSRKDAGCSVTAHRCGVEWLRLGYTLECRLRQLTQEAARTARRSRLALDDRWVANVVPSSPSGTLLAPRGHALWPADGPQTRPVASAGRDARTAGGAAPGGGQERAGILRFPRPDGKEEDP